jgi:hypothetical protein
MSRHVLKAVSKGLQLHAGYDCGSGMLFARVYAQGNSVPFKAESFGYFGYESIERFAAELGVALPAQYLQQIAADACSVEPDTRLVVWSESGEIELEVPARVYH